MESFGVCGSDEETTRASRISRWQFAKGFFQLFRNFRGKASLSSP